MSLRFRQLQAFHAIVETGTVTGAASRLGISQPGVSNLIAQLEGQTRLKLFDRAKGRLIATPEAEVLFREVETVVRGLDHVAQAVTDLQNKEAGQLTVASPHNLSFGFMPDVIARFAETRPDLSVSFQAQYSSKIQEWVAAGLFEIGVCETPVLHNDLDARIFQFQTQCALPANHPLADETALTPAKLSGQPFVVMGPEHMTLHRTREAFRAAGAELRPKVHTHLFENKLSFVKRGMGVALVDPFTLAFDREGGVVTRPFQPAVMLDMAVITARDRPLSALGREFLRLLERDFAAFSA